MASAAVIEAPLEGMPPLESMPPLTLALAADALAVSAAWVGASGVPLVACSSASVWPCWRHDSNGG